MKIRDKVKLAVRELGSSWTKKEVREHISKDEISDKQLKKALEGVDKDIQESTFFGDISNIPENSASSSYLVPRSFFIQAVEQFGETWGRVLCYAVSARNWLDTDDDTILLPAKALSSCHPYGFSALQLGKEPNLDLAKEVWDDYQAGKCPYGLLIEDYIPNVKSRKIVEFDYSAVDFEKLLGDDLVDCFTGCPAKHACPVDPSPIRDIEEIRRHLNSQDLNYDCILEESKHQVYYLIKQMEKGSAIHQASIFNHILSSPQPRYSAVKNSARLYTRGASFQNLSRPLRKTVFAGYSSFDLTKAQLAIVRSLWDVPELDHYLTSNFWAMYMAETGINDKDILKELLYGILYGSERVQCKYRLRTKYGLSQEQVNTAILSPLVIALFNARDRQFKAIKKSKSVIDAFGRELISSDKPTKKELRSALAAQAQSYEIKILLPVLRFLIDRRIPIYLLIHDGIIVPRNAVDYHGTLNALVEQEATKLGMKLSLEHEFI